MAVPKPDSILRILFLGGSTTFGEVPKTSDAFPALLQRRFADSLAVTATAYKQAECLNAGLGAGTSAELLLQYLLKFKYLNADIVVVHTGINDAIATVRLPGYTYQPDYHTAKRTMLPVHAVTPLMRLLCRSRLAAFFIIKLYYSQQQQTSFTENDFFTYHSRNIWLSKGNERMFETEYSAFYNNISELANAITAKGKKVLLVTEVTDTSKMPDQLKIMIAEGVELHRKMLLQIAAERHLPVCELQQSDFPHSMFLEYDGIHVNEEGEKRKAEKIEPFLWQLIQQVNEGKK